MLDKNCFSPSQHKAQTALLPSDPVLVTDCDELRRRSEMLRATLQEVKQMVSAAARGEADGQRDRSGAKTKWRDWLLGQQAAARIEKRRLAHVANAAQA